MKRTRIGSLALSAVILGTSVLGFAGCKKGAGKVKVIEKDTPWYDVKATTFDTPTGIGEESYSYYGNYVMCKNDVITTYSTYDQTTYESLTYIIDYGMDGNIKSQFLIRDLFDDPGQTKTKNPVDESLKEVEQDGEDEEEISDCYTSGGDSKYYDVQALYEDGDGYAAIISFVDYDVDYFGHYYIYSSKDDSITPFTAMDEAMDNGNGWINTVVGIGNGEVAILLETWDEKSGDSKEELLIAKGGEIKSRESIADLLKNDKIWYVNSITKTEDGLSFLCDVEDGGMTRFDLNLSSKEVKTSEVSGGGYYGTSVADDGKEYYVTETGVYEVTDGSDKDEEKVPVISFDNCNILRANLYGMSVVSISDTECLLFGSEYDPGAESSYFKSYKFTKADSNPNAGEKIISIGYTDYISTGIYKAIYDFNEKSDSYFITVTDKYASTEDLEEVYKTLRDNEDDDDAYRKAYNEHNSKLMDKLSVDLLAGDAPDIIFGTQPYIQLKDSKFLIDLLPNVEKDFGTDVFFTNVIDVAKTGDNLYSMPLSFEVSGIMANSKDAGDKAGFTFDEYKKFVNDVCNGKDPVGAYATRMDYFQTVFGTMADLYYDKDGNINLQTDAFYDLAKYVKDNVPESFDEDAYWDEYEYDCYGENTKADTVYLYSIDSYLNYAYDQKGKKAKDLYGYPSYDGRGPIIQVDSSVSISSMSGVQDGAWEFIKGLLEETAQKDMGVDSYTNPINVEACKAVALKRVKDNNKESERWIKEDPTAAQWARVYKESVVDDYIEALESASSSNSMDPAIITIVDEEIQAYFVGQKSIEEVTDTIQNRAQTLINERK